MQQACIYHHVTVSDIFPVCHHCI